jgi:hypothetical protein
MAASDSEEEAVLVFDRPWSTRRADFSSLKLYMYANIWTRAIIADFCYEGTSDEADLNPAEICIHGATCRTHRDEHFIPVCTFSFPGPKLSRHAPDVDGLYKYMMRIDSVTQSTLLVMAPRRVPTDLSEGCWRLDF